MLTRRGFVHSMAVSSCWPLAIHADLSAKNLRIGLISDIHKDIIHDADERLTAFITEMQKTNVDAIIQMGDFCIPKPSNTGFLDIWNQFQGPKFHILGNHDTDGGFNRSDTVNFWKMPARYYSFDLGGFHFIILDANDRPPGHKSGYPKFIAPDQLNWLKADLASTNLNTFVLSHQSLERPDCILNQAEIRKILESSHDSSGQRKVVACLNGHWHIDHSRVINQIPYVHINSASYIWLNDPAVRRPRLSPELSAKFPTVASTIPYTKPVFTILEIDPANHRFSIQPRQSEWLGPGPDQIGYRPLNLQPEMLYPGIRARTLETASK